MSAMMSVSQEPMRIPVCALARGKRGTAKFFDSAEWAMNNNQQPIQIVRQEINTAKDNIYFDDKYVNNFNAASPIVI